MACRYASGEVHCRCAKLAWLSVQAQGLSLPASSRTTCSWLQLSMPGRTQRLRYDPFLLLFAPHRITFCRHTHTEALYSLT